MSYQAKAYATESKAAPFGPFSIPRREPQETDVQIEILYCGICHSDLHFVRSEWELMLPVYPAVPGHEIVGLVSRVGTGVTKHQIGDIVGVGCLVDSDHTCPACQENLEQLCPNQTGTYGTKDPHGTSPMTYGGYSESIVVEERMVLKVPANLELSAVARCSARASRPTRRCGAPKSARARRSASSAWAASDTWASSSPRPWVRK